jgi:thymidylate synthase (FAD)
MKISEMSVEYVDHMGSDLSVVNAARVSFHKQSDWAAIVPGCEPIPGLLYEKDVKLINYLAKHNHWTPFGHTFVSMRIKAPIFVARQAVKHQVGLVWNEVSRRYVDEEPEFWFPKTLRKRAENLKQGSSSEVVPMVTEHGRHPYTELSYAVGEAYRVYKNLLNDGVAPEQARMVLPLNTMTEWIWSGSLAAFSRVCKLRLDSHSQLEIQELAGGIERVVEPLFPVSWAALMGK